MFTKLAKTNLDHAIDHPVAHYTAVAVYGAVAVVLIGKLIEKINTPRYIY